MPHGTYTDVFKQLIAFTILAINFQSVTLLLGVASVSASPHAAGTGRSAALKQNTISGFYLLDRPRVKCVDGALPSRVRQAAIIFTGTVRHLVVSSIVSRNQMTVETKTIASVEVKRVIKGQDLLDRKLATFGYSNHGNRIGATDKTMVSVLGLNAAGGSAGYSVGVAPAGSKSGSPAPAICHSTVKVNDTWIFLTNPVDTVPAIGGGRRHGNHVDDDLADFPPVVTLRLNSSLIRLSLNNIILAEAAVNGNHHVINTVSSSASCKRKICPFGAECVADDHGTATCRCVDSCNDTVVGEMTSSSPSNGPVCGTDDVTYSNECELRVVSCQQSRRIGIRWHGTCEARDPCAVKRCHFGARCVVADDNDETAYCKCPSAEECNESEDKEKNSMVCGSDDVDYVDECHMNVTSCQEQREIKVKFSGKCYPCRGVECPVNHICKLNDKREPVCRCNDDVMQCRTARYSPVCGTDDNTYPNECLLNIESCRQQIPIGVHYVGPCNEELQNSVLLERCANMKCQYYATCQYVNEYDDIITPGSEVIDLEGDNVDVRCVCPISCHDVNDSEPVCGTDGVTYDNECQLQSASCHNSLQIDVLSRGPCELCETVQCPYGAMCHSGLCVCPTPQSCPTRDDPICANDSLTYQNECVMRSVACNLAIELHPLHHGECFEDEDTQQSSGLEDMMYCDDTNCKFGGMCYSSSSDDRYRCVCFMNCDDSESARAEVCGTDGTIYNNDCALREAACLMQTYIDTLPTERCTDGSLATPDDRCRNTEFGCCADEVTTALGPNMAGCPHVCRCNPLGSRSPQCDPATGQCPCKHGVGGIRCNRCRPGYWGLALSVNQQLSGNGCTPCRCSPFGSLRDDCDQTTGRCVCRSHVTGLKCNVCSIDGSQLQSAADCVHTASASAVTNSGSYPSLGNGIFPAADITLLTTLTPATMKTSTNPMTVSNFVTVQQNVTMKLNVAGLHTPATVTSTSAALVTTTTDVMRHSDAFTVPSFSHRSYIELSPLDHGQREIIIEINFKTYSVNGILFYTGRNLDNVGHFMSLAIKDGYLEFRYDLGSGPRALRAKEKVSLNKFHKAVAKRFGRDGMLRLDNGREVSGVSPGTRQSLDSENALVYLGYPANATDRTFKNVGVHEGLKGCIESLRIASPTLNKEYELTMPGSLDITKAYGIDECDVLPCDKVNCLNGGACMFDENNGVYGCQCIDNYSGNHCEIKPESDPSSNHNVV